MTIREQISCFVFFYISNNSCSGHHCHRHRHIVHCVWTAYSRARAICLRLACCRRCSVFFLRLHCGHGNGIVRFVCIKKHDLLCCSVIKFIFSRGLSVHARPTARRAFFGFGFGCVIANNKFGIKIISNFFIRWLVVVMDEASSDIRVCMCQPMTKNRIFFVNLFVFILRCEPNRPNIIINNKQQRILFVFLISKIAHNRKTCNWTWYIILPIPCLSRFGSRSLAETDELQMQRIAICFGVYMPGGWCYRTTVNRYSVLLVLLVTILIEISLSLPVVAISTQILFKIIII